MLSPSSSRWTGLSAIGGHQQKHFPGLDKSKTLKHLLALTLGLLLMVSIQKAHLRVLRLPKQVLMNVVASEIKAKSQESC